MSLKLYMHPMSRARIALWMLEEVGAPYELQRVDEGPVTLKSAEYLKINPMGQVPTLVHDGQVITECAAICTHLAESFPKTGLIPAVGTPDHAQFLRWMFFTAGSFEMAVMDRAFPRQPGVRESAISYGNQEDVTKTLVGLLSGKPFALGETFSALDVYLASGLFAGLHWKTVYAHPVFEDYVKRMTSRPAYQKMHGICAKMLESK